VSVRVTWSAGPRLATSAQIRRAVEAALAHGGRAGMELDVVIVGQQHLRHLHEQCLGDPTPTDVISFDLSADLAGPAGELYISAEQARVVATRRGLDPRGELLLYAIHGALHLCGHDDRQPAARRRMRRAERAVLRALESAPIVGGRTDARSRSSTGALNRVRRRST